MAITSIPGGLWLPMPVGFQDPAPLMTATTMNSTFTNGGRIAFIVQVPKSGTLDWCELRQQTNANAPDNPIRYSFQGLDATGFPDGTQDQFRDISAGFGAGVWLVPPGVMTSDGTDGGSKRSVNKGDRFACVVEYTSFVVGDSIGFSRWNMPNAAEQAFTVTAPFYTAFFDGTVWAKHFSQPIIALKYSDGTYAEFPFPVVPALTANTRTFNSGSSPAQRGVKFQLTAAMRVSGQWVRIDLDNAVDLVLYDAADTVLDTASLGSGDRISTDGQNIFAYFPTSPSLSAGVDYRLMVKPTTVSNVSVYDFDISASALLATMPGGSTWMSTTGAPGAWTDSNTNRGPWMGLFIDGVDGGGAGVPNLINGGMVR